MAMTVYQRVSQIRWAKKNHAISNRQDIMSPEEQVGVGGAGELSNWFTLW